MAKKKGKKKKNKEFTIKRTAIVLLVLFSLSLVLIIGQNTGFVGNSLKNLYFNSIGLGTYIFSLLIILNLLLFVLDKLNKRQIKIFLLLYGFLLIFLVIIDLNMNTGSTLSLRINNSILLANKYLGAGVVGAFITHILLLLTGRLGIYFIAIVYLFFAGIYIFNISIRELISDIKERN